MDFLEGSLPGDICIEASKIGLQERRETEGVDFALALRVYSGIEMKREDKSKTQRPHPGRICLRTRPLSGCAASLYGRRL